MHLLRGILHGLGAIAPALAARLAERLFFSPRRRARPHLEAALLARGRRFSVAAAGQPLPAWSFGEGPTVLLVHGWEGRGAQLGAFVDPLCAAGFRVVLFDMPGHGDAPGSRASLVDFARAIREVAGSLTPVVAIVAHSMGGAAALLAEPERLGVARLVLVAPPPSPTRWVVAFERSFGLSEAVRGRFRARFERRYGVALSTLDVRHVAAQLRLQALVVHDADDREIPFEDGASVAAVMGGARMLRTQGLGHLRVLRAPQVISSVVDFLAPLATGSRPVTAPSSTAAGLEELRIIEASLFFRDERWMPAR